MKQAQMSEEVQKEQLFSPTALQLSHLLKQRQTLEEKLNHACACLLFFAAMGIDRVAR